MASKPLEDSDLVAALNAYARAGGVKTEAARILGIDRSTFTHRLLVAQERGLAPDQKVETPEEKREQRTADTERRALRAQLKDALSRLRDAEEQLFAHETLRTTLEGADPPGWRIERRKRGGTESVAVAVGSDWHAGEYVDPETVSGLNRFDLDTLEKRVRRFFEQIIRLTEINRHHTKIDDLLLFLLGDLMTGYLHFESVESNTLAPPEEILRLYELLKAGLDLLLAEGKFRRILVPCKPGNHARMTKKPVVSTFSRSNLEFMLYQFLSVAYNQNPKIEFRIAKGYMDHLTVYNKTIRYHHGHEIRYQGGIGGLFVPLGQKVKRWNESKPADLDILAHHHQYLPLPRAVVNGSLVGYNPFAQDRVGAAFEDPTQAFFLLHPTRRFRTCDWPIHLEPT